MREIGVFDVIERASLKGNYVGNDLDKKISPEHPQFGRLDTHLSELVQHVVNHGTYHRGSLTAMIRQQGYSSVPY